jgi:hypothetical protein
MGGRIPARREAITWRRTVQANVADAYWSYLGRYPRGPHMADARRLLTRLGAEIAAPSRFAMMDYDVSPPLPDELLYIERAALLFDDPAFAFEPPPPSPVYFLEPAPEFMALGPPVAPSGAYVLPTPVLAPLPVYVGVPAYVAAPSNPSALNTANNLANSPRLPPSVAPKATRIDSQGPPPSAVDPLPREEVSAPSKPPLPTVALTPLQPTDNDIPARPGIEPPALTSTLASPPAGMALQSRPTAKLWPRAAGGVPLPMPRPAMLAPPPTGMPLRTPPAATPLPAASIPLPMPRPALLASSPTRNRSKPIARAASTSSPTGVDQAEWPTAALLRRQAQQPPSPRLVRAPNVAAGVSLPKPDKKPCPIVNGRRVCG